MLQFQFTPAIVEELSRNHRAGQTSTNVACADEMVNLINGEISTGQPAYIQVDARRFEPAYLWAASFLTGYSKPEVTAMINASRDENLAAPIGTKQRDGSREVNGYVRYYEPMKNLLQTLHASGIKTHIVSASPETSVDIWANELGVPADQAIGSRYIYKDDIFTPHLAGRGGVADGADTVMPYIDGKRCWIKQEILRINGKAAFDRAPKPRRQVLAAGDSTTDLTMVSDGTRVHLFVNRNSTEIMCNAYANTDGNWIINPMSIYPKPQLKETYDCGRAHTNSDCSSSPALNMNGTDTVYR